MKHNLKATTLSANQTWFGNLLWLKWSWTDSNSFLMMNNFTKLFTTKDITAMIEVVVYKLALFHCCLFQITSLCQVYWKSTCGSCRSQSSPVVCTRCCSMLSVSFSLMIQKATPSLSSPFWIVFQSQTE